MEINVAIPGVTRRSKLENCCFIKQTKFEKIIFLKTTQKVADFDIYVLVFVTKHVISWVILTTQPLAWLKAYLNFEKNNAFLLVILTFSRDTISFGTQDITPP